MDLAAYKDKLVYYAEVEEGKNQKMERLVLHNRLYDKV